MSAFIGLVTIAGVIGFSIRQHRAERNNPFSAAFSSTLMAGLFLVPGLIGYEIQKNNWSFVTATWTGSPVWWEIWFGAFASVFAVYFWRKALRSIA